MRSIATPPARAAQPTLYICITHMASTAVSGTVRKDTGQKAAHHAACSARATARPPGAPSAAACAATSAAALARDVSAGQSLAVAHTVAKAPGAPPPTGTVTKAVA